jgi:hypothetical protein
MGAATQTLYETDFAEWADRTTALLRARKFAEIDWESVAEEVETLGRSERAAVRSQLRRMLAPLIKQRVQPERDGASWRISAASARMEVRNDIRDSPSLRRHMQDNLRVIYGDAVEEALVQMNLQTADLPADCPSDCGSACRCRHRLALGLTSALRRPRVYPAQVATGQGVG